MEKSSRSPATAELGTLGREPSADDAPTLEALADGSGFRVRIRYGKERRNRFRIPSTDFDFATRRAAVLVELGVALWDAPDDLAHDLLEQAGAADGPGLAHVRSAVERVAAGARVKRKAENPRRRWTVRELGEAWTDGTLAKEWPDQIRDRRDTRIDISRLKAHVYPVIGDVPVRVVTLEHVERVMASLAGKRPTQRKLSPLSRRSIALTLNRLFTIAVYPLKIIATSPIPKGLIPKRGKRRAMAYLYPDEDRTLMRYKAIPIAERLLWGFLAREGCRVSEALNLRWTDFDLARGAVRLDKNKTDDPRTWVLAPGVAKALAKLRPRGADGLVFPQPRDPLSLARTLRADLLKAGVERSELHKPTPERMALRVHDLRGSFVTIALANGRSESWVSDRTGHRSSQMLSLYKRAARTAAELDLGDWTPLDVALGLVRAHKAKE